MARNKVNFDITAQNKTRGAFTSINKDLNKTSSAMKKVAGAFAGVFAVRQIVQFGNQALQVADDIGKLADSVNVSTTFLQQYQFAAEQSGISTEGFTKALRFFAKGVGEATMGTGLAKRAFEEMGISLEDAGGQTKSTEDLFKEFFSSPPKKERFFYLKNFYYDKRLVDRVGVVYFKGPKSYTGEDCVEIYAHGGLAVIKEIINAFKSVVVT